MDLKISILSRCYAARNFVREKGRIPKDSQEISLFMERYIAEFMNQSSDNLHDINVDNRRFSDTENKLFEIVTRISEEFGLSPIVYAEAFGTVLGEYYNGKPETEYRKAFDDYLKRYSGLKETFAPS